MNEKTQYTIPAVILGAALIIAMVILSAGITSRNTNNIITSTGSAKVRVQADSAKVVGDIIRRIDSSNTKGGYAAAAADLATVRAFLETQGFSTEDYEVGPLITNEVWNTGGLDSTKLDLRQTITIDSTDVEKVRAMAEKVPGLVQQGVRFQAYNVEYYYSKLAEARVQLLGKAITDSKARATEIAKSAGNRVGELRSASSGVVQVLAPNSVSVEDYGSYDTSTLEKDIMVTVRATFAVK